MIRIIAGDFRSRRLAAPPDAQQTRPWMQRVKESVFNVLRGHFEGARVVDLFAGVGTIGLEAISRGAQQVLMVEQSRSVFALLEQNVRDLDCAQQADLLCGDALGAVALLRAPRPVDLLFVDPPFVMMQDEKARMRVFGQIQAALEVMSPEGFAVLRTPLNPDRTDHTIEGWEGPEIHDHGIQHTVCFYAPEVAARDEGGV
ncbi:MAG: 16S rRNA (guanine(966)-N(2))-methyltransferase RsmD [Phycisphaerales bacterium]|nr:16S rRNA (guanine(966)-N(2))-methyltransferase RsmD [Phycisphaerales bacterium]